MAALERLHGELQDEHTLLVVLGGLVPDVLRAHKPGVPPHIGTADVDLLLDIGGSRAHPLGSIEEALERMQFEATVESQGWRWVGVIEERPVRMEFLCELDDVPGDTIIKVDGCERLAASNVRGVGFAREDWQEVELGTEAGQGMDAVTARFAGLAGYLLSKVFSMVNRGLDKDYYDFVYVLMFNRNGGPREAAEALMVGCFSSRIGVLGRLFREIGIRFATPDAIGPRAFAVQTRLGDPGADEARLRNDAVAAVQIFLDGIKER